MLTSLVSLLQGNVKKWEKLMKLVNNDKERLLLNDLRNFNEIFRKDVPYDNIKSHRKPGLWRLSENTFS